MAPKKVTKKAFKVNSSRANRQLDALIDRATQGPSVREQEARCFQLSKAVSRPCRD
jgi:hypothetical protein